VLLLENAGGQRFRRIAIKDRHGRLYDDRTFIYAFRDEVDGAACQLATPVDRFLLYVQARKRRK